MAIERAALRGSERLPAPNSNAVGQPDPNELIEITIMLRRRTRDLPALGHRHISREEFAEKYGADPADIAAIQAFAGENNLTVTDIDIGRRAIRIAGTIANLSEAFGAQLKLYSSPSGAYRGRTGPLYIPSALADVVVGVFGLDNRPQAQARIRRLLEGVGPHAAASTSYTPVAVSKLYSYPTVGAGSGQTVGIIELGGGYKAADLTTYFTKLGIKPQPTVTAVGVDGAANTPAGSPDSADGEVLLDIEVIGSIAPQADIAVYFGPNTDQGFLDAITTAIHDNIRKPSVISISWGGPESTWTAQALTSYDEAFQEAGVLGVTVCVASGDGGSSDGETDGLAHVDFPASSPNVLACGGTRLNASKSKIASEVVWNEGANGASGGGVSETFPLPAYQSSAGVPVSVNSSHFKGRGVPDVSGDADPETGYQIYVDGTSAVFGGTSAVAPLWSALLALINEQRKSSIGFLNPLLYSTYKSDLHDITSGNNGAYTAGPGWDACTGWGSPNGSKLSASLTAHSHAHRTEDGE